MIKLDEQTDINTLPDDMRQHLFSMDSKGMKWLIFSFVFIVMNVAGGLLLVADPFMNSYIVIAAPVMIIINVWALLLMVRNPQKTQLEVVLFTAFLFASYAFGLLLISHKFAYFVAGVEGISFFVGVLILYLGTIVYFIRYYHKTLSTLEGEVEAKEPEKWMWKIFTAGPAIGLFIYHGFLKGAFAELILVVLVVLFGVLSIYLSIKMFYKHAFMKLNLPLVVFVQSSKESIIEFEDEDEYEYEDEDEDEY
ncbi:hypothetical protein MM221_20920 [Salipaludibacillus sp. LMS25]|jgi:hypothetical protein|uniref:hypothetical protein n=1 Tax=Salipaludibacillus sp. LMS25 TaxID=2924031 RepID=UPI0020D0827D|nr:hypothetical protein [Salipaludibacillus sp. LMS25]UTR14963.1 hypothetical protein MM221_20920 [Salipaludibacillus sp. LMS25]